MYQPLSTDLVALVTAFAIADMSPRPTGASIFGEPERCRVSTHARYTTVDAARRAVKRCIPIALRNRVTIDAMGKGEYFLQLWPAVTPPAVVVK
jgi:hypothetical protein